MKAYRVMLKSLREQLRDLRGFALSVALPAAFMVIFGLAFGGGLPTVAVLFQDRDQGEGGAAFRQAIEGFRYDDGKPMVRLVPSTEAAAAERLRKGDGAAYIAVPEGFTARLRTGAAGPESRVVVTGDPADAGMRLAHLYAVDATAAAVEKLTGREAPGRVHTHWLGAEGTKTEFDWAAPGVMVFAIMLLVAQTAMLIVTEVQRGTLQRLRLTAMTARDLFLGVTGSQMVLAAVQVPVMFAVARMMGYHAEGSLLFGMVLCVALSLCAVGCGLLVSCVARTPMEAANFGAGVLMPMVFLSGAMFPIPPVPLFQIGGTTFGLWHLLPPTHVVEALRATLTYGRPWTDSLGSLLATVVLSLGTLGLGVLVFQKVRMRTEY